MLLILLLYVIVFRIIYIRGRGTYVHRRRGIYTRPVNMYTRYYIIIYTACSSVYVWKLNYYELITGRANGIYHRQTFQPCSRRPYTLYCCTICSAHAHCIYIYIYICIKYNIILIYIYTPRQTVINDDHCSLSCTRLHAYQYISIRI